MDFGFCGYFCFAGQLQGHWKFGNLNDRLDSFSSGNRYKSINKLYAI